MGTKSKNNIGLSVAKRIYIEENGQLVQLEKVKIIWSNFRQDYKLIKEDEVVLSVLEKSDSH